MCLLLGGLPSVYLYELELYKFSFMVVVSKDGALETIYCSPNGSRLRANVGAFIWTDWFCGCVEKGFCINFLTTNHVFENESDSAQHSFICLQLIIWTVLSWFLFALCFNMCTHLLNEEMNIIEGLFKNSGIRHWSPKGATDNFAMNLTNIRT